MWVEWENPRAFCPGTTGSKSGFSSHNLLELNSICTSSTCCKAFLSSSENFTSVQMRPRPSYYASGIDEEGHDDPFLRCQR